MNVWTGVSSYLSSGKTSIDNAEILVHLQLRILRTVLNEELTLAACERQIACHFAYQLLLDNSCHLLSLASGTALRDLSHRLAQLFMHALPALK